MTYFPFRGCSLLDHESASRLLIILVIMTMQVGWINAYNEMCEA
jgi:hypothetical protein